VNELLPPNKDDEMIDKAKYLASGELFNAIRKAQVEKMVLVKDDELCFLGVDNRLIFVNPGSFAFSRLCWTSFSADISLSL